VHYKIYGFYKCFDVLAWCVGGKEGVFALFINEEDLICEAHGDDGHWELVGKFDRYWLDEIADVVDSVITKTKLVK